jgi:hypothetical protein
LKEAGEGWQGRCRWGVGFLGSALVIPDGLPREAHEPASVEVLRMQFATIIARNYRAYAEVLGSSLLAHHSGARLVVLVIDGNESDRDMFAHLGLEVALLDDLMIECSELHRMLLFYDVMEMATAVKPKLLHWLLDRGNTIVCYLDPDIVVYDTLDDIVSTAESDAIVLVPHALKPFPRDGLLPTEYSIMRGGVFNLGFIAVGQGARPFLTWWHERLATDAIDATEIGLFADQRWVDFVPTLFVHSVCKNPGMNVAYWNVHERGVARINGRLVTSNGVSIRFFHFSGFSPKDSTRLSRHGFDRPRVILAAEPHLAELCEAYAAALYAAGYEACSREPYRFDVLPNGVRLRQDIRRMYRSAVVGARDRTAPRDPLADGGAALRKWLFEPVAGHERAPVRRVELQFWQDRPELHGNFPDPLGIDAQRFRVWLDREPWVQVRLSELGAPRITD